MIEVDIPIDYIEEARKKSAAMGVLRNSITRGGGNLIGFVGEQIAASILKAKSVNTYEYDIILPNGQTADVKTIGTTVTPLPHYTCAVSNYNTRQKCDYYVFVRVTRDLTKGWFLGIIDKAKFLKNSLKKKKGEREDNGFIIKSDCHVYPINEIEKEYDSIKSRITKVKSS